MSHVRISEKGRKLLMDKKKAQKVLTAISNNENLLICGESIIVEDITVRLTTSIKKV